MTEKIGINPERTMVSWDGQSRPVDFVGSFPSKGYVDRPYVFLDEKRAEANGVLVEMEPNAATKILYVVDQNVRFQDIAIAGSGWFLGIKPNGEIINMKVGEHLQDKNPVVEHGANWTFCWISGPEGLEILDVTEPPFNPEMEKEIKRGSAEDNLPAKFWQRFDQLHQTTK